MSTPTERPIRTPRPSEEVLNPLLRRIDWRFLLTDPNPATVVCLSSPDHVEALWLISENVDDGSGGKRTVDRDVAVATDPGPETLERAWSCLRPGGFLYAEWRGWSRRGRTAIRRQLETAGFEDPSFFRPHPDWSKGNPSAWMPLQEPGAVRHFLLENRGRSRTAWRRAARRMVRTASVVASRLRRSGPLCALSRKPVTSPQTRGRGLSDVAREGWPSWNLGQRPNALSWLLLTGGLRSDSKIVALLFPDSSSRPVLAVKMPRTPESAPAVRREAEVLRQLGGRVGPEASCGIPRFLFLDRLGEVPILGETAFTGVPLLSAWTRDSFARLAEKTSVWLADFAGRRVPTPAERWRARLVDAELERFSEQFGRALDAGLLREARSVLQTLPALPIICEQRDFSPWNLLLTPEGELAVVDWESAELDGLPVLDLVYFLTNLGFSLDSARRTGRYRESYRAMLDPGSARGSLAARCVELYCSRLGLDEAVVRPLRLLAWIVHSRAEYRRLQSDFGSALEPGILRQAVCAQLFEEELRQSARGSSGA